MVGRRSDVTTAASAVQRAASDPSASVVVAASAGTGKTHVLTNRVLRLLLAGVEPSRLLCLTFTKAAAAEMANRINATLAQWARHDDNALNAALAELCGLRVVDDVQLVTARRLFAKVLDDPAGLRIQTLHAFCQAVLARFPLEARVPPYAKVLEERTARELLLEARSMLFEAVRAAPDSSLGQAFAEITRHVEDTGFDTLVDALVQERRRLLRLTERHDSIEAVIETTCRVLGVAGDADPQRDLAAACEEGAFDRDALDRAVAALARGSAADQQRGAAIQSFLARGIAAWPDHVTVFLTAKGEPRKNLATKAVEKAAAGTIAILETEQDRILAVLERLRAAGVAKATAALLVLSEALFDRYDALKRRQAALDYDDLILRTRALLGTSGMSPWVLYKLDGGIDHILIDEAQDTSPEQWDLVRALTGEFFSGVGARESNRTVFAVGDAKQSIFSFQGADPDSFADWSRHLEAQIALSGRGFAELALEVSFRSAPAILSLVDRVFADPLARDGLGHAQVRHVPHRADAAGLVELWPLFESETGDDPDPWTPPLERRQTRSALDRLAAHLIETIHGWIGNEMLPARGRAVQPGDIMLLVRRRNALVDALVRGLKARGVPIAGADRMRLTEQLAVMDLMALGRFLVLPEDDLSLAEALKSPLFGFDDDDLFVLAWRRRGTLWQALQAKRDEQPKFAAATIELNELLARTDFLPPHELYADLLSARGARTRLLGRLGPDAADPLSEFLAQALAYERQHPPSLQGFLHWLQRGETEVKRDPEQRRDELRIMTVHGAKGLQAPIVILPDTCQMPSPRESLLWTDETVLWSPRVALDDPVAGAARTAARVADLQEYHRLLYVALTRAEDRLYICGHVGPRPRFEGSWYDLVQQAMADAEPIAWPDGRVGRRLSNPQTATVAPPAAARRVAVPAGLPDFARPAPAEPVPPRPLAPSRPEAPEPPVRSPLAGAASDRFRRGRLLHALLQGLPALPPESRILAARRLLASPLHGLAPETIEALAAEAIAVLNEPGFATVFGPDSAAEVPIVGRVGNLVIAGQVDRLAVTDAEVLVVDFKTDRPPPDRADQVAVIYLRQMAAYVAALRLIYPDKSIRAALLWTDEPRLMPLPDALLTRHGPEGVP